MSSLSDKKDPVLAGVLYWPVYLEMQKRRLQMTVKRRVVSELPDLDFVELMRNFGLPIREEVLSTLRNFDEPEELVARRGSRLWYWVQDVRDVSRLLLICLVDKQTFEAIELLVVSSEDRWYLEEAMFRLNKAVEFQSIDVVYRVAQQWAFLHDGRKVSAWQPFTEKTEIAKALKDWLEMLKTSKAETVSAETASPTPDLVGVETVAESAADESSPVPVVTDHENQNVLSSSESIIEVEQVLAEPASNADESFEFTDSANEESPDIPQVFVNLDADNLSAHQASFDTDGKQADTDSGENNLLEIAESSSSDIKAEDSEIVKPASSYAGRDDDSVSANAAPAGTPVVVRKRKGAW